ncbi:SGNH/GDSL hydrolase family protein [Kriegella aquimaris]|uniref:Prolyl oligopeptidase family protein n=1 Tax=Kriegella aquimaris TaxID=192904 RepID=A0A1G9TBQ8_9FLAO|nr:GDSL-type esterase/lipase family protein [Kriegella aquimaris]SDM45064.1 Prolyl oligopeptidase family protein [Kriegella aquimaris]
MVKQFISIYLFTLFFGVLTLFSQKDPTWDDTAKSNWAAPFERVGITSSKDGAIQNAIFYRSKSKVRKPLIVSLHTWSGDYTQKDPLAKEILARDWNYIHPDFRGTNNHPQAMGSDLVVPDIADAIQYALKHTDSDPDEVHIIGVSGGGYATLLAYMGLDYPVKSFSAWAPISDIEAWYWESIGRKQKYAQDILQAISKDGVFDKAEALRRSPITHKYPIAKRKKAKLYIYEGVHDGYEGSVPITHSINMYNRLVGELKYQISEVAEIRPKAVSDSDLVTESEIINLVTKRLNPLADKKQSLYGRDIHLFRTYQNIQLTIFEGGHEQLPQALSLVPYKKTSPLKATILTIGDSNGASEAGWVNQLKTMLPNATIVNFSQSGRTIGFDNNGAKDLNALRNINKYLREAQLEIGGKNFDYIVLCLGTNDTKKIFADRQSAVVTNFEKLLKNIAKSPSKENGKPQLIFVTPPPMKTEGILEKYEGGNERLGHLVPLFQEIAQANGFKVLDVYHPLQGVLDNYAPDGIHMSAAGQKIIAARIVELLD